MTTASSSAGRYLIIGGAGFIGGHFGDHLLAQPAMEGVTVYDNFSSGREWHVAAHYDDTRFTLIRDDVRNLDALTEAMDGCDTVIHLASNPDIAAAAFATRPGACHSTRRSRRDAGAMRRALAIGMRQLVRSSTPRAVVSTVIWASSRQTRTTDR